MKEIINQIKDDTINLFDIFLDKIDNIVILLVQIIMILIFAKIAVIVLKKILKNLFFNKHLSKQLDKINNKEKIIDLSLKKKKTIVSLLQSIIKFIIWFIAIATILDKMGLGVSVSSMIATAGIGGIAIAFGAQNIVKDVVAGGFLFIEGQYEIGEIVGVADIMGTVEAINIRNTTIRSYTGELIIVPNGSIDKVINYSRGYNLAVLDISIAYEEDIENASKSILQTATEYKNQNEHVLEDPEYAGVINLAESDVVLRMIMKVNPGTKWQTERDLREKIKTNFDKQGIEIPYPRRVVFHGKE